ncbi:MAG: DUF5518 domain-containing protein [Methanothermobacter tenebrarum]|nr:DUF5518 domain-containing protein [Methanothermobacter sp.]
MVFTIISMVKWGPVFVGFILSIVFPIILRSFMPGGASVLGLFLAGFVVGLMVKEGALGGFWNATVAGAFGGIILTILLSIFGALIGGIFGFFIGLFSGIAVVIVLLLVSMIFMGIGGAIGGFLAGD